MNVRELHEHLGRMIENGKGDFEVVHAMGNGQERPFLGFEVVEAGFFPVHVATDNREKLTEAIGRKARETPRLRLFTHSPF